MEFERVQKNNLQRSTLKTLSKRKTFRRNRRAKEQVVQSIAGNFHLVNYRYFSPPKIVGSGKPCPAWPGRRSTLVWGQFGWFRPVQIDSSLNNFIYLFIFLFLRESISIYIQVPYAQMRVIENWVCKLPTYQKIYLLM